MNSMLVIGLFGVLAAYLVGSMPFGLVLTRLAGLGDIRAIGSGNIGATNVLRTGRKDLAALTLILDAGKGGVSALALWSLTGQHAWGLAAGLAAFLGHLFPVYLGFKGGKGVATGLGTLLGGVWPLGIAACLAWLVAALVFRISSLSALVAFTATTLASFAFYDWKVGLWLAALSALVFFKHRANIQRLLAGQEPKIGAGKAPARNKGA